MSDERPYHHGDLRSALIEAGVSLTRTGGARALRVREVARSVGVTPNAVYRHFADRRALILAVAKEAQDRLAQAMRARADDVPADATESRRAIQRLRAVGLGYIDFAVSEPGWFELAVLTHDDSEDATAITTDHRVPPPFQLLMEVLDEMHASGALSTSQRSGAELACWSAVHGFADLATRGPLEALDRITIDAIAANVVDTVIAGLTPSE